MLTGPWRIPEMWKDGEAWIIGGGLSMPRQFGISEKVIENVTTQQDPITVYSDYLKPLHNKHVVGVNIAFMLGEWVSVLYFCDPGFFRTYKEDIFKFRNIKATCTNHLPRESIDADELRNIKRLKRDNRYGLSQRADTICWNFNSGCAAIDFAAHAGARRILLLGFDMTYVDNKSHWHAGFPTYQKPTAPASFRRFLRAIPGISQDANRRGIEILNVSPESAIEHFPKVSLKEVL